MSTAGAAISESFLPSAPSISDLMLLMNSGFSPGLLNLRWTATMVLSPCSAVSIFVMLPDGLGAGRFTKATTPMTMATATKAISTGTMGGRVHRARSNSSVMGTCPASGAGWGAAWAGFGEGCAEAGSVFSGIGLHLKQNTIPKMQEGGN